MTEIVVIGGGIAGVSAAAYLAPHASVTLLEQETSLAYHTTGRSAAMFVINYGAEGFRPLARASRSFLEDPPDYSVDDDLLSDRGVVWLADHTQLDSLENTKAEGEASGAESLLLDHEEICDLVPYLDADHAAKGLYEPTARDIDVAGLHQSFVRIARRHDTRIVTGSRAVGLTRPGSRWRVHTEVETFECEVVVNAAGAWGDEVAALAGIPPVGLQPMRRTAFMVPGNEQFASTPMVVDVDMNFYVKPDGVQYLCSLGEENPSEPGDPRPHMEDVALAIDRINRATTIEIRTVNSQWTGLRTFAPDRELVAGEEPGAAGFFWLVGQGGTGIATAPAYGELLANLVLGFMSEGELAEIDPGRFSPKRFR